MSFRAMSFAGLDGEARLALAERMRSSIHQALFTEDDFSFLDAEPEVSNDDTTRFPPGYPQIAAQRGLEGVALYRFDVNDEGVPENIEVLDAIPHPVFGDAGVEAIRQWRYEPAASGESPRRKDMSTSFTFTLGR